MEQKSINLEDRATAYGALAYLFAESIPGASFITSAPGEPDEYEIIFRWVSLSPNARKSLAKLIEGAAAVVIESEGEQVHITLRLEN